MKTLNSHELEQVSGGGDSFAKDAGQFLGGMVGWVRANLATYILLGPGIGGAAALIAGAEEASN